MLASRRYSRLVQRVGQVRLGSHRLALLGGAAAALDRLLLLRFSLGEACSRMGLKTTRWLSLQAGAEAHLLGAPDLLEPVRQVRGGLPDAGPRLGCPGVHRLRRVLQVAQHLAGLGARRAGSAGGLVL